MDTPFDVQKYTCYFCVLGPENTPSPTPYMSGTFVLAPPPPPPPGPPKTVLGNSTCLH